MKREIKFRAWDSYQNKMYEWHEIIKMDSKGYLTLSNLLNDLIEHIKPLEYTGLKDVLGKEIYEGDIVKSNKGTVSFVVWSLNGWRMNSYYGGVEIIGNMNENPELL